VGQAIRQAGIYRTEDMQLRDRQRDRQAVMRQAIRQAGTHRTKDRQLRDRQRDMQAVTKEAWTGRQLQDRQETNASA
jgi:hypothetical protein